MDGWKLPADWQDVVGGVSGPEIVVPAGSELFRSGAACSGFPLLMQGEIEVVGRHTSGKEALWYRLKPGDICLVSVCSLLGGRPLSASARATMDLRMALLSPGAFDRLLAENPAFREHVIRSVAARWSDLLARLERVTFYPIEAQIAAQLLSGPPRVRRTHQQLADELGTAREVVTRALRRFQDAGAIAQGRGHLVVLDADWLRAQTEPILGDQSH